MFGPLNCVLCWWNITYALLAWCTWYGTNSKLRVLEISSWFSEGLSIIELFNIVLCFRKFEISSTIC